MISDTKLLPWFALLAIMLAASGMARPAVDVLQPVTAAPAHVVTKFDDEVSFATTADGEYVVLDRRNHGLYVFEPSGTRVRRIVSAGTGPGELFQPLALALNADDLIAVADSPNGLDRVQYFASDGLRVGGFYLPLAPQPRLTAANVLIASGGSLIFAGSRFVVNRPEWGALITEHDVTGKVVRQMGHMRQAGGASPDRDLDIAMNIGIPLSTSDGGFLFVFQTGVPMFRKYSKDGRLEFERHIQGPELDARILSLPTVWPARAPGSQPVVPPMVRAAAIDAKGQLWISLTVPYTYVYDGSGEKIRTVQFRGARVLSPSHLFFTAKGRLLVSPGAYEFEVN
jgi:hypothetical protein